MKAPSHEHILGFGNFRNLCQNPTTPPLTGVNFGAKRLGGTTVY